MSSAVSNFKNQIISNIELGRFTNIPRTFKYKIHGTISSVEKQKSKFFYNAIKAKKCEKWFIWRKWERQFCAKDEQINWYNFFQTKIKCKEIKLANFNFKIINCILPSLCDLFVYGKSDKFHCSVCNNICDIKHLFFDCTLSKDIWDFVYNISGLRITYRKLIIGYSGDDKFTEFLNYFISIVAYVIYKCYLKELETKNVRTFENIVNQLKKDISIRKLVYYKTYWKMIHI